MTVSPSFFSTCRASPDPLTSRAASGRLITVPPTPSHRPRPQALAERRDIFSWLADENPPAVEVLRRVSTTSSPFASLIALACDELENSLGPVRSDGLEDLERESSLRCATIEVEFQRRQESIVKLRHEAAALQDELKRRNRELEGINFDIERLHRLHGNYGIEHVKEVPKVEEDWSQYQELGQQVIPLDDEMYRQLWQEGQQIDTDIGSLETVWQQKQQDQLKEMKEYIKRRFPHLAIIR
jgi:hypothetical protein